MTTYQADKLIKTNKPATVRNSHNETFTRTFNRRVRGIIYSTDGAAFEIQYLQIVLNESGS